MSDNNPEDEFISDDEWERAYEQVKWLEKEIERLSKRKYNGFIGAPPEWIPDPLKQEFEAARKFLLRWCGPPSPISPCPACGNKNPVENGVWSCPCGAKSEFKADPEAHEQILDYMKIRKNFLEPIKYEKAHEFNRLPSYPIQHANKFDALNYILELSELGAENGMEAYLGEGGDKVYRGIVLSEAGRKGGLKSKAKRTPPYHALLRELKAKNWATLLKFLKDDEEDFKQVSQKSRIYRLQSANKIDVRVQEVEHEKKMIRFLIIRKGQILDNAKDLSVPFKTLQNLIPKYRRKSRIK